MVHNRVNISGTSTENSFQLLIHILFRVPCLTKHLSHLVPDFSSLPQTSIISGWVPANGWDYHRVGPSRTHPWEIASRSQHLTRIKVNNLPGSAGDHGRSCSHSFKFLSLSLLPSLEAVHSCPLLPPCCFLCWELSLLQREWGGKRVQSVPSL